MSGHHRLKLLNNIGFIAIYSVVFCLLISKAIRLPVTHDESWTVSIYLQESIWNIISYFDASTNNHILNTLLTKLTVYLFGVQNWSIRLPNLFMFILYGIGVYRLLKTIVGIDKRFLLALSLLFLSNPYFLDFFSLSRGYGISAGLIMLSISYFVSGFKLNRDYHIWYAFLLAVLASYANFTALLYCGSGLFVTILYFLISNHSNQRKLLQIFVCFLVIGAYLLLISLPISRIKSTNQFEYWTSKGFYQETVLSLTQFSLSDTRVFNNYQILALGLIVLVISSLIVVFGQVIKGRFRKEVLKDSAVVTGFLLLNVCLLNFAQTNLFGDPNLNGRTSIFLIPIIISFLSIVLIKLEKKFPRKSSLILSFIIALLSVQHLVTTFKLDNFREWRYDAHTISVLNEISPKNQAEERISLHCFWLYQNSFYHYYVYDEHYNWLDLHVNWSSHELDLGMMVDFYYIPEEQESLLLDSYEPIKRYNGGHVLMKRRK